VVSARQRPSVELSGQRDWTCLLGAITEDGDRFFSRFTEYVTANHAKYFILAVCKEFKNNSIVVLDGAQYFQASAVMDLAARDDLDFVTLPSYSPGLNSSPDKKSHLLAFNVHRYSHYAERYIHTRRNYRLTAPLTPG
jgi:hypothetical protein